MGEGITTNEKKKLNEFQGNGGSKTKKAKWQIPTKGDARDIKANSFSRNWQGLGGSIKTGDI